MSKLDSALEPGFWAVGCQNSVPAANRPILVVNPEFWAPHTSLPMFAPRPWGDAGCAHRFSAVAAGALSFFLFVCHTWPECIQESSTGFSNPDR